MPLYIPLSITSQASLLFLSLSLKQQGGFEVRPSGWMGIGVTKLSLAICVLVPPDE